MDNNIIDLNERRNAATAPDADNVVVEIEDGRPVKYFKFMAECDFGCGQFIVFVWAKDADEAQRRFAALSSARYLGQVYSVVPA